MKEEYPCRRHLQHGIYKTNVAKATWTTLLNSQTVTYSEELEKENAIDKQQSYICNWNMNASSHKEKINTNCQK